LGGTTCSAPPAHEKKKTYAARLGEGAGVKRPLNSQTDVQQGRSRKETCSKRPVTLVIVISLRRFQLSMLMRWPHPYQPLRHVSSAALPQLASPSRSRPSFDANTELAAAARGRRKKKEEEEEEEEEKNK